MCLDRILQLTKALTSIMSFELHKSAGSLSTHPHPHPFLQVRKPVISGVKYLSNVTQPLKHNQMPRALSKTPGWLAGPVDNI